MTYVRHSSVANSFLISTVRQQQPHNCMLESNLVARYFGGSVRLIKNCLIFSLGASSNRSYLAVKWMLCFGQAKFKSHLFYFIFTLRELISAGTYFRGFHFFEISRKKWELIFADFRDFILNENFAGTYFRGWREIGNFADLSLFVWKMAIKWRSK